MLGRMLPKRLKDYMRAEIRWTIKSTLRDIRSDLMVQSEGYFPHEPESSTFLISKRAPAGEYVEGSQFPVPNAQLRGLYGANPQTYLMGGRQDVDAMRTILRNSGVDLRAARRILDFGCSSGRMIRWLDDVTDACEVWGTDIRSSRIMWCQQYLSPPFHFTVTTLNPHLPFEDHYFGFVYAGSVFTHIDDMAHTWFLELRRIVRPGGHLYFTIHDRNTVAVIADPGCARFSISQQLCDSPEYKRFSESDFGMFTIGRSLDSQVFFDAEYLADKLAPFFKVLSVNKEAYGYQSAVLLERV